MITEKEYCTTTELAHRKRFAQFFTPKAIADFMAEWVLAGCPGNHILEPAYGLGVFSRSMLHLRPDLNISAYEVDEKIFTAAKENIIGANIGNITLKRENYITSKCRNKFDGIICNPPYLKFHDYDNDLLVPITNQLLGCNLNRFTNLYALFLLKSLSQLKEKGRCAYLIPSEFMNSDYGVEVKKALLSLGIQMHFIIFDFNENIFDGPITTSCIALFINKPCDGYVRFSTVDNIHDLRQALTRCHTLELSSIQPEVKWKRYYSHSHATKFKHLVDFSTYAKVSRGIATGANKFFTFTRAKARDYSIPDEALLECICHCTDIDKTVFTKDDFERLADKDKTMYLFNGVNHEDNNHVADYIQKGEKEEINRRFLCRNRKPWYALEKRTPPPIWVSVFNRKRLKFVRNEAQVSNLTTFHCLYITNQFVDPDVFFAYLLTNLAYQIFLDNSRQYGNGLIKFEPNDLNKSKIVDFGMLTNKDIRKIKELCIRFKEDENREYIDQIEKIFLRIYKDDTSQSIRNNPRSPYHMTLNRTKTLVHTN